MSNKNRCILIISDTHFPYSHPDTIPFIKAVLNEYPVDRVIHIGDEVDHATINFHEKDPDFLFTPAQELEKSIEYMEQLYEIVPVCDVMESNHGSMVYRRQKYSGLSRQVFKSYQEILNAPQGWKWHIELMEELPNNQKVLFSHGDGKSANSLAASKDANCNIVQGHHHGRFEIISRSVPYGGMYWGMNVGCLIDDVEMAFNYGRKCSKRPCIGMGLIWESVPKLLPMPMKANRRWTGQVPR